MNLYQKLVEIRKSIDTFTKDTEGFGFNYVSGTQILKHIKPKMDELGVILNLKIFYDTLHWEKHEYTTKKGEQKLDFIVTVATEYTWVNADEPSETIAIPWLAVGQQTDDISKAFGTATTYCERYFLQKQLGIPTDEDDADRKEPVGAKNSKHYSLSDAQIKRLYAIAHSKSIDKNTVDAQVFKKFNKPVSELSKSEYDKVCKGYEGK